MCFSRPSAELGEAAAKRAVGDQQRVEPLRTDVRHEGENEQQPLGKIHPLPAHQLGIIGVITLDVRWCDRLDRRCRRRVAEMEAVARIQNPCQPVDLGRDRPGIGRSA